MATKNGATAAKKGFAAMNPIGDLKKYKGYINNKIGILKAAEESGNSKSILGVNGNYKTLNAAKKDIDKRIQQAKTTFKNLD